MNLSSAPGWWQTPIHEMGVTPEKLYQAFKERLMSEVVAELKETRYAISTQGSLEYVSVKTMPLVDKEQK